MIGKVILSMKHWYPMWIILLLAAVILSIPESSANASFRPLGSLADGAGALAFDRQTTQNLVVVAPVGPGAVFGGQEFEVEIQANDVADLHGAQATLMFESALFSLVDVQSGPDLNSCFSQSNETTPGNLNLVLACSPGQGSSGAPLTIWVVTLQHTGPVVQRILFSELWVVDVLLSDGQSPPQPIPAEGGHSVLKLVPGVCGDQNGDGLVNIFDAIIDLQIIVGLIVPTPEQLILSDVVIDGQINIFDVILTLQHIVGLTKITDCGLGDAVEVDSFTNTIGLVGVDIPGVGLVNAVLTGPAEAHVFFEGANEGDASDNDGDGLDEVETEMVSMTLTGISHPPAPDVGPIILRVRESSKHPMLRSTGQIEENVNSVAGRLDLPPFGVGTADSFFDMYFELEIPSQGLLLHNGTASRVESTISHKPPSRGERYIKPAGRIPLLDENNEPTGIVLVAANHTPDPPIEVDQFDLSLARISLIKPDGSEESVELEGPTTVNVFFEGSGEGDAQDDNGNGLEEVKTEIVGLQLTGNSSMGPVEVRLNPDIPSLGEIEEKANNTPGTLDIPPFTETGGANSFFNVFFQIQVGSQVLHTNVPKHMRSMIFHKPPGPGAVYENPQIIPLLRPDGTFSGFSIGRAAHTPNPPPEVDFFLESLADITIVNPQGGEETVQLTGPTTVHVYFNGTEGRAGDSDGDGRDQVETEIVSMDLTGSSSLGMVVVRRNPDRRSMGEIEETTNNTPGTLDIPPFTTQGSGDSYFDVFFEIEVAGRVLRNPVPKRLSTIIFHKPPEPGAVYQGPERIELVDLNGIPSGFFIGPVRHTPRPKPIEIDHFERTTALVGVRLRDGSTQNLVLTGPATVHVDLTSLQTSPTSGKERVSTELVSMSLTGGGAALRAGRALGLEPSLGQIQENQNVQGGRLDLAGPDAPFCTPPMPTDCVGTTATSLFNVMFEIVVPGVGVLHNQKPLLIDAIIKQKPPRARYFHFMDAPIQLFDVNGEPTGIFLISAQHITGPVEIDHFEKSTAEITIISPDTPNGEQVSLTGPTTVAVFFEGENEGDADDTNNDGRDEVETEIVSLELRGTSRTYGPVVVRRSSTEASTGIIAELEQLKKGVLDIAPFSDGPGAESSFDIFFEIEVGGRKFFNVDPKHMETIITHKPPAPGEGYENPKILPLFDEQGNQTNFALGPARHVPNPRPPGTIEVDIFPNTRALVGLEFPNGTETLILNGPSEVHVFFEGDQEGIAKDDDGDGLDEVDTEMMELRLKGFSQFLESTVELRAGSFLGLPTSIGEIEETKNSQQGVLDLAPFGEGEANSFFDIVFEVELVDRKVVLKPDLSVLLNGIITHKPPAPGNEYLKPEGIRIPLRDPLGNVVAVLVGASHIPVPRPELPDLAVSIVEGPGVSCFGSPVQCDVTVQMNITNIGKEDVTGPFNVLMVADAVPNSVVTISGGLLAGASTSQVIKSAPGGNCFNPDCTVSVTVDSGNVIAESNESNNTDTKTVIG